MDSLRTKQDIETILLPELEKLPSNFIISIKVKTDDYRITNIVLLEYLTRNKNLKGIFITLNKPCKAVIEELKQTNINVDNLVLIDGITGMVGKKQDLKNCIFLESPRSLTELSIQVSEINKNKDFSFLFLDSLSTLLLYNQIGNATKFTQFLLGKLRQMQLSGIVISLRESVDKELFDIVTQFCDRVIEI